MSGTIFRAVQRSRTRPDRTGLDRGPKSQASGDCGLDRDWTEAGLFRCGNCQIGFIGFGLFFVGFFFM